VTPVVPGVLCPVPPRLCPSTLPTPCLRQGKRMQLPRLPRRPQLLGQPTDAVSNLANNIGQAGNSNGTSVLTDRMKRMSTPGELHPGHIALIVWTTDTQNKCAREG